MEVFNHQTIVADLTPQQRSFLVERSDIAGLRQLALHLCGISLGAGLIVFEVRFLPIILIIQGILIVFLFTPLHETIHQTPFRSRWLNVWVGRLCGFLVFLGPEWFRYFHFAHHRYTHQPQKDPELLTPKPVTVWQYLKHLSGLPDIYGRARTLVRNAVLANQDNYVPTRGKSKVMNEARIQVTLYGIALFASLAVGSTILFYIWILPFLLGGPFLRAYLLAEHARCPHVFSMLDNTRTTFTNRIVRFLAWNMPYHAEHHVYPSIPFHKLPHFHTYTKAYISHKQHGYFNFNQNYLVDSWSGELKNKDHEGN